MQHQDRQPGVAMTHYHSALSLRPQYTEAYLNLGLILSRSESTRAESKRAFEHAIITRPGDPDIIAHAYVNIGGLLTDEATRLDYYRRAAAIQPRHPQALNNVGLLSHNKMEKEEYFRRAIAEAPSFADAHFNLAHLNHFSHPALAERHYKIALALRPGFSQAINNLRVLAEQKRPRGS